MTSHRYRFKSIAFDATQFHASMRPWPEGVELFEDEEGVAFFFSPDGDSYDAIEDGDWIVYGEDDDYMVVPDQVFHLYFEPGDAAYADFSGHYDIADIDVVANRIADWRAKKGFYTPSEFSEAEQLLSKLMLVVTEVSEAAQEVRKDDEPAFVRELADVLIRMLDLTGTMGYSMRDAINSAMEKNESRPRKHGRRA